VADVYHMQTMRGSAWRGRDCNDLQSAHHPGARYTVHDSLLQHCVIVSQSGIYIVQSPSLCCAACASRQKKIFLNHAALCRLRGIMCPDSIFDFIAICILFACLYRMLPNYLFFFIFSLLISSLTCLFL